MPTITADRSKIQDRFSAAEVAAAPAAAAAAVAGHHLVSAGRHF